MAIDIAICVIVFISAVCYAHIGFIRTVISLLQWVACLACGLFFSDDIREFLYDVGIGPGIEHSIAESLSETAEDSGIMKTIPGLFREWAGSAADYAAKETSANITSLLLTVAAFLLIVLAIKIVLFVITHLLSKKYHDGAVAFLDSAGGLIIGVVLGVFYVFIAMAVLLFVMQWLPDSTAETIHTYLDESYFSGIIYDNNPLLTLIHNF